LVSKSYHYGMVDMPYHYPYHQPFLFLNGSSVKSNHSLFIIITVNQIQDLPMNQNNISGNMPFQEPSDVGKDEEMVPSVSETSDGITINFHSAEFNRTDDLNDCSGNYRTFQSLDGIVTADMRHQMERRSGRDAADASHDDADLSKTMEREIIDQESPHDTAPLTVISRGRTLIVDADAGRATACAKCLADQGLACTLLVTKQESDASFLRFAPFRMIEVDAVSIAGAFGSYSATVTEKGDHRPLREGSSDEIAVFDLVLDLQPAPSYSGDLLPMGYYAPGTDPATLREVMAELPEMRGRFQRPQFTTFLKSRCLHGRSRTRDCRRCLALCPFGAIQSTERTIAIDHYRCQGCGACAMVCPADAIQLLHPSRDELLNLLRRTLEEQSAGGALPPTLVISESETAGGRGSSGFDGGNPDRLIHLEVEQISHVGLETLLAALAHGADAVVVACGMQTPPGIREAVEQQALMGRAILRGLGMPEDKIGFVVVPFDEYSTEKRTFAITGRQSRSGTPLLPSAPFSPACDKRTGVRLAARHLYDQSGIQTPGLQLPMGSPFGAVAVDSATCTLCMACAVACPSGALSAGGDVPRIEFIESRCHQCGLCEEACPEGALRLLPRILCDADAVEAPVTLNEAEPVRCIVCGLPFASQAMIDRIRTKLTGHWMYAADRQLRRLQMCRACRTQDALTSQDMKSWNRS
jgi:ferredoxin